LVILQNNKNRVYYLPDIQETQK
jgi:hypothetical protein